MKKYLLFLLLPFLTFAQADFPEGINPTTNTDASASKIAVQSSNGTINTIDKETQTQNSAGALSGFVINNNGNGTINLTPGVVLLRATNGNTAPLLKYSIGAITNLALTDNSNNFLLVDYNAGSPTVTVTTNTATINTQTNSLIGVVARVGTSLHYLNLVGQNLDANAKLRIRFLNSEGLKRAQGAVIGAVNRNLTLTAGLFYSGLIPVTTQAFNTVTPDTFTLAYNNGSVWTRTTGQTQINNTQYNSGGTLTNFGGGPNHFRTDYVYLLANNPSKLYVIMGTVDYSSLGSAVLAPTPAILPVELQSLGILVGQVVIQKNASTMQANTAFGQTFTGSTVNNHNDLAGLNLGDFQHLTVVEKSTIFNALNYVTPEQYGAIGDGVTDDKVAIQNAVNSGKKVLLSKKRYYISGSIEIPEGCTIEGTGVGLTGNIYITANAPAFLIKGGDITIHNVSFKGDGDGTLTPIKPLQHGIAIINPSDFSVEYQRIIISDCVFYTMNGAGLYSYFNGALNKAGGFQISNSTAYGCSWGAWMDIRSEYNIFTNFKAYFGGVGFRVSGGNNIFTGGILGSNKIGVMVEAGANDGHTNISSTSINHNQNYAIQTNGVVLGYTFDNCMVYANDIYIANSIGIRFMNCDLAPANVYVQNSSKIQFNNNKFQITPTLNFNWNGTNNTGSLSDISLFNNKYWVSVPTLPAGIYHNQLNNSVNVVGTVSGSPAVFSNEFVTLSQANGGTYTPVTSSLVNTSLVNSGLSTYTEVNGIVTVRCYFSVTITSANTATSFEITLPVNKTHSANYLVGQGAFVDSGVYTGATVSLVPATNEVVVTFKAGATTGTGLPLVITYQYPKN